MKLSRNSKPIIASAATATVLTVFGLALASAPNGMLSMGGALAPGAILGNPVLSAVSGIDHGKPTRLPAHNVALTRPAVNPSSILRANPVSAFVRPVKAPVVTPSPAVNNAIVQQVQAGSLTQSRGISSSPVTPMTSGSKSSGGWYWPTRSSSTVPAPGPTEASPSPTDTSTTYSPSPIPTTSGHDTSETPTVEPSSDGGSSSWGSGSSQPTPGNTGNDGSGNHGKQRAKHSPTPAPGPSFPASGNSEVPQSASPTAEASPSA